MRLFGGNFSYRRFRGAPRDRCLCNRRQDTWNFDGRRGLSELNGSDTGAGDFFGDSVAISGTIAVVGAEDNAHDAGRAYLFSRNQAGWGQVAELKGSDTVAGDNFGWSVAMAGDTVVVGAPSRSKDAGRAYVFGPTSAGCAQVGVLKGTGTVVNDGFGASVAVSGTVAVVGASGHDDYAGAAYVFTDAAGRWQEKAELEGPGAVAGDEFGWSVATSGTTAVVGAQGHADDPWRGIRVRELRARLDADGRARGIRHRRWRFLRQLRGHLGHDCGDWRLGP